MEELEGFNNIKKVVRINKKELKKKSQNQTEKSNKIKIQNKNIRKEIKIQNKTIRKKSKKRVERYVLYF